jgi:hypothetical protein
VRLGARTALHGGAQPRACAAADEMIRQVTILSPERGVMLMRLRDEARMTLAVYETMYLGRCVARCVVVVPRRGGAGDASWDVSMVVARDPVWEGVVVVHADHRAT